MSKSDIDVSLLITFHNEGVLAHSTLNSMERCRRFAEEAGISTEYVLVFDSCDPYTKNIILNHPASTHNAQLIEVQHCDLGASRNSGIASAAGKAIAILDGDDYFSKNWIERAWHYMCELGPSVILHPEFVVSFGTHSAYCWQVDQKGEYFNKAALLTGNFWTSWTFADRNVYESCPYVTTRASETGFGYEDWHWNCETIASGFKHQLAWGAVGFYRRKKRSLVNFTSDNGAIIPKSNLFCKNFWLGEAE